ncbi:PEP-CTERM sorting domain-containing protein [Iodobacter fluviatilis]|uniref:Secreted protein with PEP-CTERM sorting signal n=1 Tax=Iodobacter fluviatilis TaxID=537 RepID=A0A377Q930_9NEIS|nr:PEP-CTERM sorting domain-containing protein [Iodobacter fluviatilis]TCU88612.1 putative secreted protein with PEP-CTERM sorting signal [Iodobacter fluviatilis]STQ91317.1 Uncharacterised protein [Iodobacter fluviatilis]
MKYLWAGIYIAFSVQIASHSHASVFEIKPGTELNTAAEVNHFVETPIKKTNNINKVIPEWKQLRISDMARHSTSPAQNNAMMAAPHKTIPEPETYLLISLGVIALISRGRHRNR